VAAHAVNRLPRQEESLYIAYAAKAPNGRITVLRIDENHNFQAAYLVPETHPSYRTDKPLGLAVRSSAFPQKCNPWDPEPTCVRNYLYLVWKDILTDGIYTSVLQNARPGEVWYTRSVWSLYSTKTGVSWTTRKDPDENLQAVFAHDWKWTIHQFHGYGRY
jgi:hypothetical protein